MNEEEKKAVKYFYNLRATIDESNMLFDEDINIKCGKETIIQITTILNLIEKLQKENKTLKNFTSSIFNESIEKDFIPVQKVKDIQKEKAWALESYDCTEADYKQSQAIGAWVVLQELLEGRKNG